MISRIFAAAAIGASVVSATTLFSACHPPDYDMQPGKTTRTIAIDGIEREYIVHVPQEVADRQEPVPVVFMFHGTSGDGEKFYNISQWVEKSNEEAAASEDGGFIAVFPSALKYCFYDTEDGVPVGNRKHTTKWNDLGLGSWVPCDGVTLADDVKFFRAMLAEIETNYPVDSSRIYVSGFSNGGNFVSALVTEASELIAAANVSSGNAIAPGTELQDLISIYHMGGSLEMDGLPMDETLLDNEHVSSTIGSMLDALKLEPTYAHLNDEYSSQFHYTDSTIGADNEYRFVVWDGMDHKYPNGTNYPVRAADFLWEFFKTKHR